ncbi:WYL domain-containing protein, partial [Mesorhizobium sp. M4B.F.Ca.ET.190.01.1.1]
SNPTVGAPLSRASLPDGLDIAKARASIRKGHKIRIRYRNEQGDESERVVWPTMIGYAETVRLLAAWCELRQDFRHFRTDRIGAAEFLDERIGSRERNGSADIRRTPRCPRGRR